MEKKITILVLIAIVLAGMGVFAFINSNRSQPQAVQPFPPPTPNPNPTPPTDETPLPPPPGTILPPPCCKVTDPVPQPPILPPPPPPPQQNVSIVVNDYSATPSIIEVAKGNKVNLTVQVSTDGVYYGGIELRSTVVSTGAIAPGGSKTVSFTANQSFDLVPYWPASGVKKDYVIKIMVKP